MTTRYPLVLNGTSIQELQSTDDIALDYSQLIKPKIYNYSELVGATTASSNVITLAPANGNIQTYTLPANTTINPDTSSETINNGGRTISLFLSTGATPYAVTFSASFKWTNTLPTIAANKTYEYSLRYVNATIGWVCAYIGAV
jgi:hypothetical protein